MFGRLINFVNFLALIGPVGGTAARSPRVAAQAGEAWRGASASGAPRLQCRGTSVNLLLARTATVLAAHALSGNVGWLYRLTWAGSPNRLLAAVRGEISLNK